MRLRGLRKEFGDSLEIEWRSFLLRPHPGEVPRDLERFRAYTESWKRPAADADAGTFRVWSTAAGPPTHSVPPHVVAKAAATLGAEAFDAVHERLLHAYFAENRDVTDSGTLRAIWGEAGLPDAEFVRATDRSHLETVAREHNEAIELGVSGVPAVRMEENPVPIIGAQPIEVYRRWIQKTLDAAPESWDGKDET